jgi:hypothetical protein
MEERSMIESRNVHRGCIRRRLGRGIAVVVSGLLAAPGAWSKETLQQVLKRRGLAQQGVLAAAKTYVPTGKRDEFIAFSSGGQSGMVLVYGVPSMRILKYIAVFDPEPWPGYGFEEESKAVLNQGRINGRDITWGTPTTRPRPRRMATTTASSCSSTTRRRPRRRRPTGTALPCGPASGGSTRSSRRHRPARQDLSRAARREEGAVERSLQMSVGGGGRPPHPVPRSGRRGIR